MDLLLLVEYFYYGFRTENGIFKNLQYSGLRALVKGRIILKDHQLLALSAQP